VRLLLLFLQGAPRHDEVLAALPVLDDPERVDVPFVIRRGCIADDVDLGQRTEGALAGDAHFVSALHRPLDLAFHGEAGAERVFELPIGHGAARELPGKRQTSLGRDHHRLDAVADGDVEEALVVLQFADLDLRLALAADVDERHLRPIATIVPSMVSPRSKRLAWREASNIAAKSSSGSLTIRSLRAPGAPLADLPLLYLDRLRARSGRQFHGPPHAPQVRADDAYAGRRLVGDRDERAGPRAMMLFSRVRSRVFSRMYAGPVAARTWTFEKVNPSVPESAAPWFATSVTFFRWMVRTGASGRPRTDMA